MKFKKVVAWAAPLAVCFGSMGVHAHQDWRRHYGVKWNTLDGRAPIVIGHRGTAGRRPEHTLESYRFAIELGADFVEPDLVVTKDGHLIARHEPLLDATTDVAKHPEFAAHRRTRLLDGVVTTGFFTCDFTLAEIKQLRAVQPRADRSHEYDGLFAIPTLDEIIDLVKRESARRGRTVGIYPETKHPSFHFALGLPLEERLLDVLSRHGLNHEGAPVFIQSFETANLMYLHGRTKIPLVQLIDADDVALDGSLTYAPPFDKPFNFAVLGDPRGFADLVKPQGLADIAKYAQGIGPWKRYIVSVRGTDANGDGKADDINGDGVVTTADRVTLPPTNLVQLAHRAGLLVHPYTFRDEDGELAADYGGDPRDEYVQFFKLGVDGVFSDFADTAVAGRREAANQLRR
ncbi:MAG: glycerophosphodiester phosphodiesterase [Pseudomonadota bacterium]